MLENETEKLRRALVDEREAARKRYADFTALVERAEAEYEESLKPIRAAIGRIREGNRGRKNPGKQKSKRTPRAPKGKRSSFKL